MSSIPDYHRAGSAASTSSRFVTAPSTAAPSPAPSESPMDIFSRLSKSRRSRVSFGPDNLKSEGFPQRNRTGESKLIQEIKELEGYKQRALSAEEDLQKVQEDRARLEADREWTTQLAFQLSAVKRKKAELENELNLKNSTLDERDAEIDDLTSQLADSEKRKSELQETLEKTSQQLAHEKSEKDEIQSQLSSTQAQKSNIEKAYSLQVADLKKLRTQHHELGNKHRKVLDQRNEAESRLFKSLGERFKVDERYNQVIGLLESLGPALEAVQKQQEGTHSSVLCLRTLQEEMLEQSQQQHADMCRRHLEHVHRTEKFKSASGEQGDNIEKGIATLSEQLSKSDNASEEKHRLQAARLQVISTSLGELPGKFNALNLGSEPRAFHAVKQLQKEMMEALASMNDAWLQILGNHYPAQQVRQESSPPSSPLSPSDAGSSAQSSTQSSGKNQRGFVLHKRSKELSVARFTTQPFLNMRTVSTGDSARNISSAA